LAPEPPPIPGDDDAFQPEEGQGLSPPEGQTQIDYAFEFQVPEFEGKNQARLRGLIDYDVRWLMQFMVSNSQDPGIRLSEFGIVTGSDEPIFVWAEYLNAIENPIFSPANPPAFADAGADQVVEVGSTVVLDAGRTYDGFNLGFDPSSRHVFEKDALAFTWEWISGPQRVEPAQDDPSNPQATATLNMIGEYVFRVTVDDNVNSLPSTDSVAVTVVQDIPGNQAPIAVVDGPAGPVTVGDLITLDGSGSTNAETYEWHEGASLLGTGPIVTVTLPLGVHLVTLTATSASGETDTDDVLIAVNLEDLVEDIVHRVLVEAITSDPIVVERIERHIKDFLDKLDD